MKPGRLSVLAAACGAAACLFAYLRLRSGPPSAFDAPLETEEAALHAPIPARPTAGALHGPVGRAARAPGEPLSAQETDIQEEGGKAQTNESLQGFLQSQQKDLGIQKIFAAGQVPDSPSETRPDPRNAMSLAESRPVIQALTKQVERLLAARRPPSVAISGSKPALLQRPGRADPSYGVPLETGDGTPGAAIEVARSKRELLALWTRAGLGGAPPELNFERQMLLLLGKAPASDAGGLEIESVQESAGEIVVLYRAHPPPPTPKQAPSAARAHRVVSRSDLPIRLQRIE